MKHFDITYPIYYLKRYVKTITLQDGYTMEELITTHQTWEKEQEFDFKTKQQNMMIAYAIVSRDLVALDINEVKLSKFTEKIISNILSKKNIDELYEYEFTIYKNYFEFYKQQNSKYNNMIVYRLLNFLQYHYLDNERVKGVAKEFGYTHNYLNKVLKEVTGKTIKQHITVLKIEKAKQLLKSTHLSILEISAELDFYDIAHFSKIFKKEVGVTPSNYKKYRVN